MSEPRTKAGKVLLDWLDYARTKGSVIGGPLAGVPDAASILAIEAEAAAPDPERLARAMHGGPTCIGPALGSEPDSLCRRDAVRIALRYASLSSERTEGAP